MDELLDSVTHQDDIQEMLTMEKILWEMEEARIEDARRQPGTYGSPPGR